ncbi:MAG: hypothetical protein JRD89_02240 [Deltaproteobacteria bacterium]|nr:hypothetical protein [Deltaproteobacteria bacterium]
MTERHGCSERTPSAGHGPATDGCDENEHGEYWVGNGEYGSQVAFCPFCGARAPSPPIDLAQVEYSRTVPGDTLRARYILTGDVVTVQIENGAQGTARNKADIMLAAAARARAKMPKIVFRGGGDDDIAGLVVGASDDIRIGEENKGLSDREGKK